MRRRTPHLNTNIIFYLCLLFLTCPLGGASGKRENRTKAALSILGLFPMTGSVWPGGHACLTAVQMALDHINARDDILADHRIRIIYGDDQCDEGISTNMMYKLLYEAPAKPVILGPACSTACQATSQSSYLWNITQVSYGASSASLSDRKRFPRFFRFAAPDTSYTPARIALMKAFNWQKISTLHQSLEIFSTVTDNLIEMAKRENISVVTSEIFKNDPAIQVANLKKKGARIIIGGFYQDKAVKVFCEAYKQGLYGPKIVWILNDWIGNNWFKTGEGSDCTPEQIALAADGHIRTGQFDSNPVAERGIAGITAQEFDQIYAYRTNYSNPFGMTIRFRCYDATWFVAKALNTTVRLLRDSGNLKRLENFNYMDSTLGDLIFRTFTETSIEGVSGTFAFKNSTPDPINVIKITQMHDAVNKMIGIYHPYDRGVNKLEWMGSSVEWRTEDGAPPKDSLRVIVEERFVPVSHYTAFSCLATLGIVLALVFLTFNIVFRKTRRIKMSSPNMNNIILMGCVVMYTTVLSQAFSEQQEKILCKVRHFTLTIGFAFSFGALFSKTWRVHVIFAGQKAKKVAIKDGRLMIFVGCYVTLVLLVLVIWEFVDPMSVTTFEQPTEVSLSDPDILIQPVNYSCDSLYRDYFMIALYVILGALLAFGAFLAWETRKVKIDALNDSQLISMCIYNAVILSTLAVTLEVAIKHQAALLYGLQSGFLIAGTTVTQCIIFLPKLVGVFTDSRSVVPIDAPAANNQLSVVAGHSRATSGCIHPSTSAGPEIDITYGHAYSVE